MTILCGTEWGAVWGSAYGPCDTTDHVEIVTATARARLMEGTTFAALVQLVGEAFESVQEDAWVLSQRLNISAAAGTMLDDLGDNVGLARLGGVAWTDAYYRKVLGAWIPCEYGGETIPKLMTLLAALSDGAVEYTVTEVFPCHVIIDLVGINGDDTSLWVQILEAARPRGIQFWVTYSVVNPGVFILGESLLGGPDLLAGMYTM
jgi:hypothetical protein